MIVRPATPADLAEIARIQAASADAAQWKPEGYECLVATEADGILGFAVTRRTAPGEYEILNLAVRPEARRRGVGTALVLHALAAGGDWFLEVRESNQPAQALYRSLGFSVAGGRPEYYDSPPEAGIVMRKLSC